MSGWKSGRVSRRGLLAGGAAAVSGGALAAQGAAVSGPASPAALFARLSGAELGADRVLTSGHSRPGEGAAFYVRDAAVDPAYVSAHPKASFLAAGGRGYRLDPQQRLTIQMFGGRADGRLEPIQGARAGAYGVTDNAAALRAALSYLYYNRVNAGRDQYYAASARIHFPAAEGVYDFNSTVEIRQTVILSGDSSGHAAGAHGSQLRWRPGMHGLVFHHYPSDLSGRALSPTPGGSTGSVVDGLYLAQHAAGNDYARDDFHGLVMRASMTVRNSSFVAWSGNGIEVTAGAPASNANLFFIENCSAYGNEHGFHLDGGDANAGVLERCDATDNRGYGIFDSGFLGNTIIGCHCDQNGVADSEGAYNSGSVASYRGNLYYVRAGQADGAKSNSPTGTAESNQWWGFYVAGGTGPSHPEWSRGMRWREGGAYRVDALGAARSVLVGCYSEGAQGASYLVRPALVVGGLHGAPIQGDAIILGEQLGNLQLNTGLRINGNLGISGTQAAALPGRVVRKLQIFDEGGNPLGFIPIYDNIG